VSARFKGKVTLSDLDPPNGYKISGEGEGRRSPDSPRGGRDGGACRTGRAARCSVTNVEAQIGGKLAQLGQRLNQRIGQENWPTNFFCQFRQGGAGLAPPQGSLKAMSRARLPIAERAPYYGPGMISNPCFCRPAGGAE